MKLIFMPLLTLFFLTLASSCNAPSTPPVLVAETQIPLPFWDTFDWSDPADVKKATDAGHFPAGTERCAPIMGKITPLAEKCPVEWLVVTTDMIRDRLCKVAQQKYPGDDSRLPYKVTPSRQYLLNCDQSAGNYGCEGGGLMDFSLEWIAGTNGIALGLGFQAKEEECFVNPRTPPPKPTITISGYLSSGWGGGAGSHSSRWPDQENDRVDENTIKDEIWKNGPIVAGISFSFELLNYGGGLYTGSCDTEISTAVRIVGWGVESAGGKETPFWKIATFMGEGWGERGYLKLPFGENKCGIATSPSAALGVAISP